MLVAVAAALLAVQSDNTALVYVAVVLWGLGWGGVPTLLQTAVGDAGGEHADAAQAMLVTQWNAAMAGGGIVGGVLLDALGSESFPWTVGLLLLPVIAVILYARHAASRRGGRGQRRPTSPSSRAHEHLVKRGRPHCAAGGTVQARTITPCPVPTPVTLQLP